MEAVGSRPARASSRYAQPSLSSSFSGPVRRWEKKWVYVSSSPPPSRKRPKSDSHGGVLLCKWTPLSHQSSDADQGSGEVTVTPRRKFRYAPIAVFEKQRKEAAKGVDEKANSGEASQATSRPATENDDIYEMLNIKHDLVGSRQVEDEISLTPPRSSRSNLNLGFYPDTQNT